jgi:hypothetical protein
MVCEFVKHLEGALRERLSADHHLCTAKEGGVHNGKRAAHQMKSPITHEWFVNSSYIWKELSGNDSVPTITCARQRTAELHVYQGAVHAVRQWAVYKRKEQVGAHASRVRRMVGHVTVW